MLLNETSPWPATGPSLINAKMFGGIGESQSNNAPVHAAPSL